ncbi:MAG: hypothetical protein AAF135_11310 [Bacteroidota bacterium]
MRRYVSLFLYITLGLVALVGLNGCGSSDLSLINDVKRFEPEWMNLSEKVIFLDRYLEITGKEYEAHISEVSPLISESGTSELLRLRRDYKKMSEERETIEEKFRGQQANFEDEVKAFHSWQNRLMKGKLDEDRAKTQFTDFQASYNSLNTSLTDLQDRLIRNIENHNSIMGKIASKVMPHSSYDIMYR